MTKRQTFAIVLLSLAHGMSHAFLVFFSPLLVLIRHDLGLEHLAVAALVTIAYTINGVGALPAGMIADRVGHKRTIILSTALAAGGCLVGGFASSYGLLAGGFLLIGVGASLYHPPALAYVSLTVDDTYVGKAMGLHGIGANILLVAAPVITGFVASFHSWQAAFAVWGVLGLALAAALSVYLPEASAASSAISEEEEGETDPDASRGTTSLPAPTFIGAVRSLMTVPMGTILFVTGIHGMVFAGVVAYLAPFLQEVHGGSVALSGIVAGLLFAGGILGQPLGGQMADRQGRFPPVFVATALVTLSLFLLPLLGVGMLLYVVAFVLGFMVFMKQPPMTALVSDSTDRSLRGTAYGLFFLTTNGAGGLSPVIAGVLGDQGRLDLLFFLLAALTLITWPFLTYLRRQLAAVRPAAVRPAQEGAGHAEGI